jgi:hypothetical protein
MLQLNAVWNQVMDYFWGGHCSTHRRRLKDVDGDNVNDGTTLLSSGTGDATATTMVTKMKDVSHNRLICGDANDLASSIASSHAAAAAAVAKNQNRQLRDSWGSIGVATLAAVIRAQRLAQAAEEEQQSTWIGKVIWNSRQGSYRMSATISGHQNSTSLATSGRTKYRSIGLLSRGVGNDVLFLTQNPKEFLSKGVLTTTFRHPRE